LRPEVAAWIDRSPDEVLLVLENVGGVDALEVDIQARWKLADQEVEALEEIEKYRLPLAVLSAAKKTTFELKFPEAQSPQLFLRLSWKNRAGRVEKRSLALQT
jgi:succinyl-CoA synthetase beta subunit